MVSVAPEVNGVITEVLVRENQRVRRGDLLFRIDPRPFRIALAQADAQIAAAQVQVNQLDDPIGRHGRRHPGRRGQSRLRSSASSPAMTS